MFSFNKKVPETNEVNKDLGPKPRMATLSGPMKNKSIEYFKIFLEQYKEDDNTVGSFQSRSKDFIKEITRINQFSNVHL